MLALFAITLFLSSALLFIAEPMFAKMVLPKLGGTPAVWNVCMVFYQAILLAGYAYAHELAKRFTPRHTALLQLTIIFAALLALPIHLPHTLSPALIENPTLWVLALLAVGIGIPFFVLTTYSSTLQTWYANTSAVSAHEPYVLYSAGNLGSLLGLFSYPALIERHLGLAAQSRLWEWGYLILLVLTVCCALSLWIVPERASSHASAPIPHTPVTRLQELKWVALAFIPSSLMLGITTALTTELPPIPLLWVLPLALYLLSFVLVFAAKPTTYHGWVVEKLPILLAVMAFLIASGTVTAPVFTLPFYLLVLLVACVACHGELAISRPSAAGLTRFYLALSIGGVLGGIFNAIVAPAIFRTVVELPLVLFCLALALSVMGPRQGKQPANKWDFLLPISLGFLVALGSIWSSSIHFTSSSVRNLAVFTVPIFFCLSFAGRPLRFALGFGALVLASGLFFSPYGQVLLTDRSFFGVYRVSEYGQYRILNHGTTIHGMESVAPDRARDPLSYYYRTGPIGEVFATAPISQHLREIAVIGLGAGSLACYVQPGRHFTFYEIDPLVENIAHDYFNFLRDCPGETRIVIGDARLSLRNAPPHKYDMVVADAFSSDSVPMHLVTREAIELYLGKLANHGLLAFNISNRYLDLRPVLGAIAQTAGLECLVREDSTVDASEQSQGKFQSTWLIMARRRADFATLASEPDWHTPQVRPGAKLWTDDYSSLAGIIHWTGIAKWQ